MNPPTQHASAQTAAALVRHLLRSMSRTTVTLPESATLADDWTQLLDQALPAVGLTPRFLSADPARILEDARPDLPLITWIDAPTGGHWVVVHASRFGRVKATTIDNGAPEWTQLSRWMDDSNRTWARIVPLLPASPLGPGESHPRTPIRRIRELLVAERGDIAAIVVFAVGIGLLSLATPLAIQLLINWLAFGALLQPILTLGIALLSCLTLVGLMRAAQRHAVEIVQRRIFVRTVADLTARLSRVRLRGMDGTYGPELANRYFDVLTLQKAASTLLLDGLAAALQAAVGLLLLAFYHPLLLVFDGVVVVLVAIVLVGLARGAEYSAIVESKKKYAVAAWLEELARHPTVFKFGTAGLASRRIDELSTAYLDARDTHFRVFFRQYIGMQGIAVVLPAALLVMTGWLVLDGQLTLGQLVAAEFIVASALAGVAKFTDKLETIYDLLAGIDKLGALFDLPMERSTGALRNAKSPPPAIKFESMTCRHDGAANGVGPLELSIPARGRVAFHGVAGSGKSLLAQVTLGLRSPTAGRVLIDGVPMDGLRPDTVYADSMLLTQDDLFSSTIRENLTLGHVVDEVRVWEVLDLLGLSRTIRDLSDGLETSLVPSGAPLSHGVALGLLFARALLLEPRLLVVDGLTEALAPETREKWIATLVDPARNWTLVLLSHNTQATAMCDVVHSLNKEATDA